MKMSSIYHGFNEDKLKKDSQCYNEYHCLYCYFKTIYATLNILYNHRIKRDKEKEYVTLYDI